MPISPGDIGRRAHALTASRSARAISRPMIAPIFSSVGGTNGHKWARARERMSSAPPLPSGRECHLRTMRANAQARSQEEATGFGLRVRVRVEG